MVEEGLEVSLTCFKNRLVKISVGIGLVLFCYLMLTVLCLLQGKSCGLKGSNQCSPFRLGLVLGWP